ncbi:MAG: TraB/GumN family protein [Erysipelotrichaceae bacterium]|nr:TraB/GumN family protein [Erysipelotrichaceae bacterium]
MNENIVKLTYQDKEIYLVKTAHVSKNSVQDVEDCVNEVNPDAIAIELDEQRYKSMTEKDKWRDTDIVKIIKDGQVGFLLVNVILSSFQRRMAKSMDSNTGAEMMKGIELANQRNAELVLADRSIKATFSRIWNKLGLWEKSKLLTSIITSIFDDEDISEEELAALKEADALEAALSEVGKEFPMVKKVLVDERDAYLAQKIKTAKGNKIVAIIGAAHAKGIERNLENDVDINELADTGAKNKKKSIIKWIIPIALIAMVIYTIINNSNLGLQQLKSWVLWNGTLSALGVLCAGGHIFSIITAFVMAPITSLNPLLAAGWFAGMVEAMVRKPKVKDFEDIAADTETIKGFWKNRVTKTLMVVIFANLFSTIGTFVSGIGIVKAFIETL